MNATEINKKRGLLEILIHDAILDSMQWITSQCNGSPQEPDYIATLSTRFPKNLFHILSTCFPKRVFSVTGVYCHQKPIVRIDPKKNPELGDLLLVYIDRDKNNNILMNSLLLQAKVSDVLEKRVSKKEQHQLELYRQWPPFTYQNRADYLNGQERNIVPKTINDGAQYLMIDDNPFTNGMWGVSSFFPMGCAIPDNILRVDKALSEELIDFFKFKSGRTVDFNYRGTEDDWSKMIWELLLISSMKYSKRKNAKMQKFPRLNACVNYSSENAGELRTFEQINTLLDIPQNFYDGNNEPGGISVLFIESGFAMNESER